MEGVGSDLDVVDGAEDCCVPESDEVTFDSPADEAALLSVLLCPDDADDTAPLLSVFTDEEALSDPEEAFPLLTSDCPPEETCVFSATSSDDICTCPSDCTSDC